jgi:hypothetical protein
MSLINHDVSVTITKNDRKSESKRIDFNRLDGLRETVEIRRSTGEVLTDKRHCECRRH